MSNVGKTMVKGHGLLDEGRVHFDELGRQVYSYEQIVYESHTLHAKCRCGALSSPGGLSKNAAKKWHRQHKADVLAAEAAR